MLRYLLGALTRRMTGSTLYGVGGAYLTRYTLLDLGKTRIRVKLHHFHRSDEDPELHSHPWAWAVSLILAGGYRETRSVWGFKPAETRIFRPGAINRLRHLDFHRVELLETDAWTLFITGPQISNHWFFYVPDHGMVLWTDFIRAKGLEPIQEE